MSNNSSQFEEFMRHLIDKESYVIFTFDKSLNHTAMSLKTISNDDLTQKSISIGEHYLDPSTRTNEYIYRGDYQVLMSSIQKTNTR